MRLTDRRHVHDTHNCAVIWVIKTVALITIMGMVRLCVPLELSEKAHSDIKEIVMYCAVGMFALLGNTARTATAQNPMPVEDVRAKDNPLPVKESEEEGA